MNFKEAKNKLKKMANGKFHSITYQLTEYKDGEQSQQCSLYIYKGNWVSGETWDIAFQKLEIELGLLKPEIEEIEEIGK